MTKLVTLNNKEHNHLRIRNRAWLTYAASQHMHHLRVTEVPNAASSMPLFISKRSDNQGWSLSALTSIIPGQNFFVEGEDWLSLYQPAVLQTYPLYLKQADNIQGYEVGIVAESEAFSAELGEPLFTEDGQPSLVLSEKQKLLEASLQEDVQTHHFVRTLSELALIKAIDLILIYADGSQQPIKGLYVIDEDNLRVLPAEKLQQLNQKGYLVAIHGLLISLFQLNNLVQRNNASAERQKLKQIKLETVRDRSAL